MASEITQNVGLKVVKGSTSLLWAAASPTITWTGTNYDWRTFSVPTTAGGTAIPISASVATLGVMMIQNMDATNYVDIGPDSSGIVAMVRIKPGETYNFRLTPGITLKGLAHTGACVIQYLILED